MKNRVLLAALLLIVCVTLCACGGQTDDPGGNELYPVEDTAAPVPGETALPEPTGNVTDDPDTGGDTPVSNNENTTPAPQPTASGSVSEPSEPVGTPIIPLKPQVSSSGNLIVN